MRVANVTTRLLSLAILFVIASLVLLTPLTEKGITGGRATFCLGFVLLFGYYLAKLLGGLRIPSISSYIVVGILCGPFVLDLLSKEVVASLQLFDDVALSVIALIAGGELRLNVLKTRKAAFFSVILGQIVFVFLGAAVALYLLRGQLGTLPVDNSASVLALALLFGLVLAARSPSTTIGVITESRAKGPVTEVLVGVTVLLDVVILLLAALIIPASETLSVAGRNFSFEFIEHLGLAIFGSIGIGLVFGVAIATYIRWVGGYLPIFLMGMGLLGSSFCRFYNLEPLLAFMIAGFFVQNFSVLGERLIYGLERSAFPVYVVFFAISGASIDLAALRATWLLALVLVCVRAAAFYAGTFAAARAVKDLRPHAHSLWTGFLAQAGVTVGIATLFEERLPWGGDLKTITLAMVAINQLIGPVALKLLLEHKGEAGGMDRRSKV